MRKPFINRRKGLTFSDIADIISIDTAISLKFERSRSKTMSKGYPVGKAQGMVLHALGRDDIQTYQEAEQFFEQLGIIVIPVRKGRTTEPSITVKREGGDWNVGGDADSWDYGKRDLSAIDQWVRKEGDR
jgi:hypothetical protein